MGKTNRAPALHLFSKVVVSGGNFPKQMLTDRLEEQQFMSEHFSWAKISSATSKNLHWNITIDSGQYIEFKTLKCMTHERKAKKHEAKLSVSNIFLSVSKYFEMSKTQ